MDSSHPLYGLLKRLANGDNVVGEVHEVHMVEIDMESMLATATTLGMIKVLEDQGKITDILEEMAVYIHGRPGFAETMCIDPPALHRAVRNGYNMQLNIIENVLLPVDMEGESPLLKHIAAGVENRGKALADHLRARRDRFMTRVTS